MLLILAGVSISLVVGQNGVLTRATDSSNKTKVSQMQEAFGLAIEDVQTEYFNEYVNNASLKFSDYLTEGKLEDALDKQGYTLKSGAAGASATDVAASSTAKVSTLGSTNFYYIKEKTSSNWLKVKTLTVGDVGASATYGTELNED